jgi:uncharacterized membrane protein HdeD (DUF308 family)
MVSIIQGLYYIVTGLWPIVYMPGFLSFTGPKTDLWLVRVVGWLLVVSGIVLVTAAVRRRQRRMEIVLLGMGDAAVFAAADVVFSLSGRIPGVYLLDAGAQALFLVLWVRFLWLSRSEGGRAGGEKP